MQEISEEMNDPNNTHKGKGMNDQCLITMKRQHCSLKLLAVIIIISTS